MNLQITLSKSPMIGAISAFAITLLGSTMLAPSVIAGPFDRGAHAEKRDTERAERPNTRAERPKRKKPVSRPGRDRRPDTAPVTRRRPNPTPGTRPTTRRRPTNGGTYKRPAVWDVQDDAWDRDRDRRRDRTDRRGSNSDGRYDGWRDRVRRPQPSVTDRDRRRPRADRRTDRRRDTRRRDRHTHRRDHYRRHDRHYRPRNRHYRPNYRRHYRPFQSRFWTSPYYRPYRHGSLFHTNYRSHLNINFVFGTPGYSRYRWVHHPYALYRPGYVSYGSYVSQTTCEYVYVEANHYDHTELIRVKQCYNPWDGTFIVQGSEQIVDCRY